MKRTAVLAASFLVCAVLCSVKTVRAQQLEPRAYSLSPVGTNFLGMAYFYSSGGAVLDPSLPVENIEARVHTALPFYGRTFGFFGRPANASIAAPFAHAVAEGDVQEASKSVDRTGFGDPAVRLAVNLTGGPALSPKEFRAFKPGTTLGASITVIAPFGQYDSAKLINLGTNRRAFRPELGLSLPAGPWDLELYAGVWLFTANNDFFGGQVRRQDPLVTLQTHIVYTIRPRGSFRLYLLRRRINDGQRSEQERPAGQNPWRADARCPGGAQPIVETDLAQGSDDPDRYGIRNLRSGLAIVLVLTAHGLQGIQRSPHHE